MENGGIDVEYGAKRQERPGDIQWWRCQRLPAEAVRQIAVEAREYGLTKYADVADVWIFLRNA